MEENEREIISSINSSDFNNYPIHSPTIRSNNNFQLINKKKIRENKNALNELYETRPKKKRYQTYFEFGNDYRKDKLNNQKFKSWNSDYINKVIILKNKPQTPHNTSQYLTKNLIDNIKNNSEKQIDEVGFLNNLSCNNNEDDDEGNNIIESKKSDDDNYNLDLEGIDLNSDFNSLSIVSPLKKRLMSFEIEDGNSNGNNNWEHPHIKEDAFMKLDFQASLFS